MLSFVLRGGEISRPRVTAMRIVPPLQELEDSHSCLGLRPEPLAIEQLAFQGREEALAHRVVVAVAGRFHRGADTGFLAPFSEGDRGVLASLVGMLDDCGETAAPQLPFDAIPSEGDTRCGI